MGGNKKLIEPAKYKQYLEKYLNCNNIEINYKKKPPVLRCLLPGHLDENPSAVLYDEHVFCPVCGKSYDIFDVAGYLSPASTFPEKIKHIEDCLSLPTSTLKRNPEKQAKKKIISTPLDIGKAKIFYNKKNINESNKQNRWGEIKKVWPYINQDGDVICVDVRFEKNGNKTVINFWNENGILAHWSSPPALYGIYEAYQHPEKPILINEGCKAAEASRILIDFIPISWNRGTNNAKHVDWSIFKNRDCYMIPDDDPPGIKAAQEIKKQLPNLKIVKPLDSARKIKKTGADIVEWLQVFDSDIEKITNYIKENIYIPESETETELNFKEPPLTKISHQPSFEYPFKMLGIADDKKAYFVGRHNRLLSYPLDILSQSKLQLLAPMSFWKNEYSNKGKVQWSDAIDDIIEFTGRIDFNIDNIRGRGAWKDEGNKICYHDGTETIGEINKKRLYLRKRKKSIGLKKKPININTGVEIAEIVHQLSFGRKLDAIRCLGWSSLSPFAGALSWRPAVLLTGASGSGKTTVVDSIVKKISSANVFSGAETTSAGLRQFTGMDSTAIILEEAECDTPKKKQNREDLFSLMRQSTSDDAPNVVKGSKDGTPVSYKMCNMFMFVAISPEVESVADDNRIFRINMVKPKNDWLQIRDKLKKIMTEENCNGIRSLVWQNLKKILENANNICPLIQDLSGNDLRTCYAESLLFSTYYNIFQFEKSSDVLEKELSEIFSEEESQKRNETEELLDRLLDEAVFLPDSKTTKTLRYILQYLKDMEGSDLNGGEYRETIERYGLSTDASGNLYIAINHHEIMKIIQKGKGYQRFFWRHPGLVERSKPIRISGKTRRCVMIKDVLDDDTSEESVNLIPF